MRDRRCDEHDRSGLDLAGVVSDRHPTAAGDHVVGLVFGVRTLEVRLAGREDVQPDAEIGGADELEVWVAGRLASGEQIGQVERIHRPNVAAGWNRDRSATVRWI